MRKMVEKKGFQRHARNVSSVSDISITIDPLKREEGVDIKVVFLLDSWTERNMMFEAINKSLLDGQSSIMEATVLNHHWEQLHNDCRGHDCKHCIRSSAQTIKGHERRGSADTDKIIAIPGLRERGESLGHSLNTTNEGYFRFKIDGQPFRLMLLSKDRQNMLKIISYDFLAVCMQLQRGKDSNSCLDQNIWEFEWKRLNRHGNKALAPVVLLGYFRDILRLGQIGHGDPVSLEKIILSAKDQVQKAGRKFHAIPRFCDFVTGSSRELYDLFLDMKKLFTETGYILQQCALSNNTQHFKLVLESPSCTEMDLMYRDSETGDNPVMIAAKLRHKDLVSDVLRSPKFQFNDNSDFLKNFIHSKNKYDQTLLHMVAIQGPELEEQKLLILRKEISVHCLSELTHIPDQLKLQRCLRSQLKSSAEAAIMLDQARCLQGIPKTLDELKKEKTKVWSKLFFSTLFLSLIFNAVDTGSDIMIMMRYFHEFMGDGNMGHSDGSCAPINAPVVRNTIKFNNTQNMDPWNLLNCSDRWASRLEVSIQCFPKSMNAQSKFGYTLFFILVPWPFFIYEFFTSRTYESLVKRGSKIVEEMAMCNGPKSLLTCYLKLIFHSIIFISCVTFWPIAVLFIKYYNDGKFYLSKGAKRVEREKKIETSEVLWSTARVMEVSLESSFQPTIQLYLLFPNIMASMMNKETYVLQLFKVCKTGGVPVVQPDQTISIITSILSLSWCFTSYHATLKRGALDKDLAALFYRAILFLSVLFQILGRLFIIVFFSYSFGPGNYYPLLIFLGGHICLMSTLHFVFSDAKKYWTKGGVLNLSFFHYLIGNGLANIYIHNWIRMDPLLLKWSKPMQHVSTLIRQFIFDFIFLTENTVLIIIALHSNITELHNNQATFSIVLIGFTLIGLILKCVYYRYLHIWAWLIMDYTTIKEDGHWKCILFSNMYLCGRLRERELLLCCIPRPLFQIINFFFGERDIWCTGTSCSLCGAMVGVFLFPLAVILALIALATTLCLMFLFTPVFIVLVLPCLFFAKCRQFKSTENVVKIVDSDSRHEGFPLSEKNGNQTGSSDLTIETTTETHNNCTNV